VNCQKQSGNTRIVLYDENVIILILKQKLKKSPERSGHCGSARTRKKYEYEGRRSILFKRNTSFCFLVGVLLNYYMDRSIFIICKTFLRDKGEKKHAYPQV